MLKDEENGRSPILDHIYNIHLIMAIELKHG